MTKAIVFPGQGSQIKGMGESLFQEFPEITNMADNILGYSIEQLCLQDPNGHLGKTQYTQPALFLVNALSYLKEDIRNDYLAGHSLGEYNALCAAGAFDLETGLKIVKKRGELMSQAKGGGMAAIIGINRERVQQIISENDLSMIDIANDNSPKQVVISGSKADIEKVQDIFEQAGAKLYMPLRVSGAFHSRYMQDISKQFSDFLNTINFSELKIPVISNVEAVPYPREKIKQLMTLQLFSQVKWCESIQYIRARGIEDFTEMGPGKVLTNLIRQILST